MHGDVRPPHSLVCVDGQAARPMLNRWKVARANLISATSVRSYLAGVLSFIRPHDITEYSSEVAVEQAVLLAKLCPLYAAFGTMTVLLLVA